MYVARASRIVRRTDPLCFFQNKHRRRFNQPTLARLVYDSFSSSICLSSQLLRARPPAAPAEAGGAGGQADLHPACVAAFCQPCGVQRSEMFWDVLVMVFGVSLSSVFQDFGLQDVWLKSHRWFAAAVRLGVCRACCVCVRFVVEGLRRSMMHSH